MENDPQDRESSQKESPSNTDSNPEQSGNLAASSIDQNLNPDRAYNTTNIEQQRINNPSSLFLYRDKNLDEIELVYLNKINNAASSKEGQEWSEQLIKYKEQKRKEKNNEYQNKFSVFAFITGLMIFGSSSLSGNLVFSLSTMSLSNQVILSQEIDNKLDDNLVYFKGEKWNIAIPVATIGVFSIVLGMLTMMLIESRLKK